VQPGIQIVFTDLAPGEKLSEEMLSPSEAAAARQVGKILVCPPPRPNGRVCDAGLGELRQAAADCRRAEVTRLLQGLVPGYRPCVADGRLTTTIVGAAE